MKIDLNKLQNVVRKPDGRVQARCPACAAHGADEKGEHLVVFADGKFGCVAHPADKIHNQAILMLVGVHDGQGGRSVPKLDIKRQSIMASTTVMIIGQIGTENPTPAEREQAEGGNQR